MPPEIQTSFIPKKPVTEERVSQTRSFNILGFLAIIIFFASVAAAGGFYFYKTILSNQITDMSQSLERSKAAFEPSLISDLSSLDKRLNSSKEVLGGHIAVSPIFKSLEQLTLKSIRFTKFSYALSQDGSKKIEIKMSGQTAPSKGYYPIALQSNKLSENKYVEDIVFSNLSLTQGGGVSFDLTFSVSPEFMLYEKDISKNNAGANS